MSDRIYLIFHLLDIRSTPHLIVFWLADVPFVKIIRDKFTNIIWRPLNRKYCGILYFQWLPGNHFKFTPRQLFWYVGIANLAFSQHSVRAAQRSNGIFNRYYNKCLSCFIEGMWFELDLLFMKNVCLDILEKKCNSCQTESIWPFICLIFVVLISLWFADIPFVKIARDKFTQSFLC